MGNGGWRESLGQKGISTHPFQEEKWKGVTMMVIHREGRRGTAVGEMSVNGRGYVVEHEGKRDGSSSNSSSTCSSKSLDGRWDAKSLFPFDRGKSLREVPSHVLSSEASLVSWIFFFVLTRLLSSFWTSRGHRCRSFSPPVLSCQFLSRIGFRNLAARRFFIECC